MERRALRGRLTYANVTASLALFLVLAGGGAYAAGHLGRHSVGTRELKKQAVTSAKVKDGTLRRRDLRAGVLVPGETGPRGPAGTQGPEGPQGEIGPSGVVASVDGVGGSPAPSSTTDFLSPEVTVEVGDPAERVLVAATQSFGTSGVAATSLNLFICWRQPPGQVQIYGNGILGLKVPPNTRVPMSLTRIMELPAGTYEVGMCGYSSSANWNDNDWGTTNALVLRAE